MGDKYVVMVALSDAVHQTLFVAGICATTCNPEYAQQYPKNAARYVVNKYAAMGFDAVAILVETKT